MKYLAFEPLVPAFETGRASLGPLGVGGACGLGAPPMRSVIGLESVPRSGIGSTFVQPPGGMIGFDLGGALGGMPGLVRIGGGAGLRGVRPLSAAAMLPGGRPARGFGGLMRRRTSSRRATGLGPRRISIVRALAICPGLIRMTSAHDPRVAQQHAEDESDHEDDQVFDHAASSRKRSGGQTTIASASAG